MDKRLVKISKTLSMLLRHHPEKLGLVLDQYGRTDWKTLVRRFNAHYQMHLDRQVLQTIMAQSTKKRFALEGATIRRFTVTVCQSCRSHQQLNHRSGCIMAPHIRRPL